MHISEHLREPVLEAFDCGYPTPEDVIKSLGGDERAKDVFGRLWNCSDILPGYVIDHVHTDWPEADRMRGTYGALAQWVMRYYLQQ